MLQRSREEICKFIKETLQDQRTGKYSHSKIIAMLGFIALTFFMWKLIITGAMAIDYFIAYATYCTGHQTINKWLDGKNKAKDTE